MIGWLVVKRPERPIEVSSSAAKEGRRISASITSTRLPILANASARPVTQLVLPSEGRFPVISSERGGPTGVENCNAALADPNASVALDRGSSRLSKISSPNGILGMTPIVGRPSFALTSSGALIVSSINSTSMAVAIPMPKAKNKPRAIALRMSGA